MQPEQFNISSFVNAPASSQTYEELFNEPDLIMSKGYVKNQYHGVLHHDQTVQLKDEKKPLMAWHVMA